MPTYKLPVTWQMAGFVEVMGKDLADAIEMCDPEDHLLPKEQTYVKDSIRLTTTDTAEIRAINLVHKERKKAEAKVRAARIAARKALMK